MGMEEFIEPHLSASGIITNETLISARRDEIAVLSRRPMSAGTKAYVDASLDEINRLSRRSGRRG